MFLAIKEMRFDKLKYSLIIGIMILIAYVVFMLSGLADGLKTEFRQVIDDWHSAEIVLSENANRTLLGSMINANDLEAIEGTERVPIGFMNGVIEHNKQQENVAIFATNSDAFILPRPIKGRLFSDQEEAKEVIVSEDLLNSDLHLNQFIRFGQSDDRYKIVGVIKKTSFSATPVVYISLTNWRSMKFPMQTFEEQGLAPISAIVLKEKGRLKQNGKTVGNALEKLTTQEFINELPGYSEQNLTLNGMVYFLFVIVIAIIGIFMYVMTLQKQSLFAVMKVEGIQTTFIAKSILYQSLIIGALGVGIAVILALLTAQVLPSAMPFVIEARRWGLDGIVLVIVAVLGGLFSLKTVTQVDPINAI